MDVHAMFYVSEIKKTPTDYISVTLHPVTRNVAKDQHSSANPGGGYESPNIDWSKYTPSGSIQMNVTTQHGTGAAAFEDALARRVDIPITFHIPDAVED